MRERGEPDVWDEMRKDGTMGESGMGEMRMRMRADTSE